VAIDPIAIGQLGLTNDVPVPNETTVSGPPQFQSVRRPQSHYATNESAIGDDFEQPRDTITPSRRDDVL
jgi:hypothetical protein